MRHFYIAISIFFILFPGIAIDCIAQCGVDSAVIRYEFDNNNQSIHEERERTIYHTDSGNATVFIEMSNDHDPWSSQAPYETFYSKSDTLFDSTGLVTEILISTGTVNGWEPDTSIRYSYNTDGKILSKAILNFSGTAWDSTSLEEYRYDAQNHLLEKASFDFNGNVRLKINREEYIFQNDQLYSRTVSLGDTLNNWLPQSQFIYTYTGLIRTSCELSDWDSGTASWISIGSFPYLQQHNFYSFQSERIIPVLINSVTYYDTLRTGMDTLENIIYTYRFHFIDSDRAGSDEKIYISINQRILISSSEYCELVTWFNGTWEVLDRPDDETFTYDAQGRLIEHSYWGNCTNPCGGGERYVYDNYGRLVHFEHTYETMVSDYDTNIDWTFPDMDSINVFIPQSDQAVTACHTFTTNILVSGGCGLMHYQWSPSANLSSDTILNPVITPFDTIEYVLTAYDDFGRADTAHLIVYAFAGDRELITDTIYCNGSGRLRVNNLAINGSCNWYWNSDSIQGVHNKWLVITQPGDYYATYFTVVGQNSNHPFTCLVQTDTVTIDPLPAPVLVQNADTLFCDASAQVYEWYLNTQLIASASDSFLIINTPGSYHVTITTDNGCSYTSPDLNVISTEIATLSMNDFRVLPNPFHEKLQIFSPSATRVKFQLLSLTGQVVLSSEFTEKATLELEHLHAGVYILELTTGEDKKVIRIVKE